MQRRRRFILYILLIFAVTGPACSLTSNLAARLAGGRQPTATRPRHFVVLPPAPAAAANPAPGQETSPALTSSLPTSSDPTSLQPVEQLPPPTTFPVPTEIAFVAEPTLPPPPTIPTATPFLPRPRPAATPTPDSLLAQLSELLFPADKPTATPTRALHLAALPTIPPSPTATPTFTPSPTPTETPFPTDPPIPAPIDTPVPSPTDTPIPLPTHPPAPTPPPVAPAESESTFTSPVTAPDSPATSGYDFLLAEFYNSPTSNSFIVIYVAIVDANEIPIGDMKVVGTRLDHKLTYESPLSTWHFEGYNAPGEVIKSGNVKFEPPGGIETTSWVLHLEDANGNRLSDDVPFDTNQNDKQWYFIKFRRKF